MDPIKHHRHNKFTLTALGTLLLITTINALSDEHIEQHLDYSQHHLSPLDAQKIEELLHWVEDHVSEHELVVDGDMPDVIHVSHDELIKVAFGKNLSKIEHPEHIKIYGLYNFVDGAIYLLDTIDIETEKGKAILLHELTHYLQYQNHLEEGIKCMNELERLAYTFEEEHMEEHHETPAFQHDDIKQISKCR